MTPEGLKKAATERTCGNPTDEAMLQAFSATELTSATSPQGSTDEPDLAWIRLEGRTFLHNPSMLIRRHVVLRALPVRITIADTFGVVRVKPLRLHIEPGQMVEFRQAYLLGERGGGRRTRVRLVCVAHRPKLAATSPAAGGAVADHHPPPGDVIMNLTRRRRGVVPAAAAATSGGMASRRRRFETRVDYARRCDGSGVGGGTSGGGAGVAGGDDGRGGAARGGETKVTILEKLLQAGCRAHGRQQTLGDIGLEPGARCAWGRELTVTELVDPRDMEAWRKWWDGESGNDGAAAAGSGRRIRKSAIGLDPGVDVFLTGYFICREGAFTLRFGVSTIGRLRQLDHLYGALQGRLAGLVDTSSDVAAAVNLQREMATLLRRQEAIVEQLHKVAAKVLVGLSDLIVLPALNAGGQLSARGGAVGPAVRRGLLGLSHGRFRVLLQRTAANAGAEVVIFHEAFTSKFCGRCVCDVCGREGGRRSRGDGRGRGGFSWLA